MREVSNKGSLSTIQTHLTEKVDCRRRCHFQFFGKGCLKFLIKFFIFFKAGRNELNGLLKSRNRARFVAFIAGFSIADYFPKTFVSQTQLLCSILQLQKIVFNVHNLSHSLKAFDNPVSVLFCFLPSSANINDRSLLGRRDSEIAAIMKDREFVRYSLQIKSNQIKSNKMV